MELNDGTIKRTVPCRKDACVGDRLVTVKFHCIGRYCHWVALKVRWFGIWGFLPWSVRRDLHREGSYLGPYGGIGTMRVLTLVRTEGSAPWGFLPWSIWRDWHHEGSYLGPCGGICTVRVLTLVRTEGSAPWARSNITISWFPICAAMYRGVNNSCQKKTKQDFENKLAANVPIPILHFSTTDDAIPGFQIQETELCTERLVLSMISITCLLLNHQMSVSVVDPGAGPLIKSTPGRLQWPFLPPANEVWGKVIFSEVCVKNSVHRGACMVVGGMRGCFGGVCGCQGGICGCRGCVVVGGMCGCWGVCMVAGGHAWLLGGVHGCRVACVVVGCVCMAAGRACMVTGGCAWLLGACVVPRGHAWLWGGQVWLWGVHGCRGACVVVGACEWLLGGVHGCWWGMCGCWGVCMVAGGMRGCWGASVVVGGMLGCWGVA